MPRCKARAVSRNEVYLEVRHSDEERAKRSIWAFFNSLLIHCGIFYVYADSPV